MVVASLPTMVNALKHGQEQVAAFLRASAGRLFVVFDEAHHAPAESYRKLLVQLREQMPAMRLLGMTATPTHGDENKAGWLLELFPQGIVYQVTAQELMAANVLVQPVPREVPTDVKPEFDEAEYEKWVGNNRDLPESIIKNLAENRDRNNLIVRHYLGNRAEYGKTIVFADRWQQCEYLSTALKQRGVEAGAIYHHEAARGDAAEQRNRRTKSSNAEIMERFRHGDLDVLINVRMATEGTDVPRVQTVFLTRQTTSKILLTQMVGRALRGPKTGGTEKAYIVAFTDDWKKHIHWAGYEQLTEGGMDDGRARATAKRATQLVSIDLVQRLARQMDGGQNVNPTAYKTFLPVGWYRTGYSVQAADNEDVDRAEPLHLVFEHERRSFERFLEAVAASDLAEFAAPSVTLQEVRGRISEWEAVHFAEAGERIGGGRSEDLFDIARHMAQNNKVRPRFFPFEQRQDHDLDAVMQNIIAKRLPRAEETALLGQEYERDDRYWKTMYPRFREFKSHFDGCYQRFEESSQDASLTPTPTAAPYVTPEQLPLGEPPDDVKRAVKERDGGRCLCCGYSREGFKLQIDHIRSVYQGGGHDPGNLQTLCERCNGAKKTARIDFRLHQTRLAGPATDIDLPFPNAVSSALDGWHQCWHHWLRGSINMLYRCDAVIYLTGTTGDRRTKWQVSLRSGNPQSWLADRSPYLTARLLEGKRRHNPYVLPPEPDEIIISG